jgi:hypothetical protein
MRPTKGDVYRSGVTASKWNYETSQISVGAFGSEKKQLHFRFELASKGGGTTDVSLRLEPISFDAILNEMWKIAPKRVARIMARQLHDHHNKE